MNQPHLYNNFKQQQEHEADEIIRKFLNYAGGNGMRLIDFGTGDGGVLAQIICKHFDLDYALGVDKSIEMVEFGRKHYENEKIKFCQLDIGVDIDKFIRENEFLVEKFDIATSLYCLHWVQDLRTAFSNVVKLLNSGGWFCCTMIKESSVYDAYLKLSLTEKYRPYMLDVANYLSPTRGHKDLEPTRRLLIDLGFHVEIMNIDSKFFDYGNYENYFNFLKSINPFFTRMPLDMRDAFIGAIAEVEPRQLSINEDNWKTKYDLMTIIARFVSSTAK